MSDDWVPEPDIIPGMETPNGHHIDGALDFSTLVPEDEPGAIPEPNPVKEKFSFKSLFTKREKKEKVRKPTPPMPRSGIAGSLANIYTGFGMTLAMVDRECGMAVVESAEDCAQAWEDLARKNPKVRRALLAFLETSDVAKLAIAHAPILAAVAAHHVPLVREGQIQMVEFFANTHTSTEGEVE